MVTDFKKFTGGGAGGGGGGSWGGDEPTVTLQEPTPTNEEQVTVEQNDELQQTTTEQRGTTADRIEDFTNMTGSQLTDEKRSEYQAELDRIKAEADKAQEGINKLREKENAGTETPTGDQGGITDSINQQIADIEVQALLDAEEASAAFDDLQNKLDSTYRGLVSSIKGVYASRIREMKQANQRLLQTKRTVGLRTGRARYTPVMQDGLLTQEEIEGIKRVTALSAEMNSALAKAADAKNKNDLKAFNDNYDRIEKIREDAKEAVNNLYEQANKEYELMLEAKKEERIAAREDRKIEIQTSDQVAPALASRINQLSTPEQQAEFINRMAENVGVDPYILFGSVQEALNDEQKRQLDLRNIESQIGVRWSSENRAQDKWNDEQQEREGRSKLRMELVQDLENGTITIEEARTAWGMAFPITEFDEEFNSYIDEL